MMRNNSMSRGGLYRSRRGLILGVCRGIADYFDLSVFWVRSIFVIVFIFTGFWPIIGLYLLAALLMKSAPGMRADTGSEYESQSCCSYAKHSTADRLKRKWHHLEKRIRKMEDKVTSREYEWNHRFHG
jgi:phage shock protein C